MVDIVIFIISVIVLLFSVCFGFIVFGAAFKLMMEASDRLDRWIKHNADRLFTLDIDFLRRRNEVDVFMALTKEQEVKIKKAAIAACPEGDIWDGIVAGIKAYDLIKDQERKQRIFDAIDEHFDNDSDGNDDCYVVFRPFVGSLAGVRVYNSEEEMLQKLSEEFTVKAKIAKDTESYDGEFGWEHECFVQFYNANRGDVCIMGYCDCKTFKRG